MSSVAVFQGFTIRSQALRLSFMGFACEKIPAAVALYIFRVASFDLILGIVVQPPSFSLENNCKFVLLSAI